MSFSGFLEPGTSPSVKLGPFVDSTDGVTAETALTISQADVRLSKNGGDFAQKNESSSATHDENGFYDCSLNGTDTNTPGYLTVAVSESGALPVRHTYVIGQPNAVLRTTIATLSSQTSFTLTAGHNSNNSVYRGDMIIIRDADDYTKKATGWISAYTAATRTVTLNADPTIFTMAASDAVEIIPAHGFKSNTGYNDFINTGSGRIVANVAAWNGSNVASPDSAGYPVVTIKDGTGQGEIALTSGAVDTVTAVTALTANRAEPGQGAPSASTSVLSKVDYLYKHWRNRKTQDATTFKLFADDGTTVDQKLTVSDDGTTFDAGEVGTGP